MKKEKENGDDNTNQDILEIQNRYNKLEASKKENEEERDRIEKEKDQIVGKLIKIKKEIKDEFLLHDKNTKFTQKTIDTLNDQNRELENNFQKKINDNNNM